MSRSSSKRIISLLFVFVVSVALVGADLVVLAQNENTQTEPTRGGQMTSNTQTTTTTTGNTSTGGRRRRGRRRGGGNANTAGDMSGNMNATVDQGNMNATMSGNANMGAGTTTTGGRRRRGRRRGGMAAGAGTTTTTTTNANMGGEQTDLSGTYTGTVNYPEGGMTGNATLTITGNQFTLTPEGGTATSGRITAVTTRGYTAVTMMFGDLTPPSTPTAGGASAPPLPAVSVRARKSGDRLTLTPVAGEKRQFSFTSGATGGTGRRGRRGRRRAGMAATTTGTTTETTTGEATMTTGTETTTTTTGGRRRRRRGSRTMNMNGNTGGGNTNMGGGGNMNMGGNGNTPPQ